MILSQKFNMSSISRRAALATGAATVAALTSKRFATASQATDSQTIAIDPTPQHSLSPYLYMQFMEPLGATDGSVEAAWDNINDVWREDVIAATQELAPSMMRWGGIFSDYYRWREGVGPRTSRKPMTNLLWGGLESNQIGTAEFVDFCRQVKADPLMCVNFESDGRQRFMHAREGVRTGDAAEAAAWVAYCNQPDNAERLAHGIKQPYSIGHWQIGNETSYDKRGFNLETASRKTLEFSQAMRKVDPDIKLIAWGDDGWGARMMEVAGEYINYIAFHQMFDPDDRKNPVLGKLNYRVDPDKTWDVLMKAVNIHEKKIVETRQRMDGYDVPLALTECHFDILDRDRGDVNSAWATGVAYARILNLHERHGDKLKIATAADFCGNRWQNNAVMIPTPNHSGPAFLMPVARVMSLYRRYSGKDFVSVTGQPAGLDITSSRSDEKIYLHVVNINRDKSVHAKLSLAGLNALSGQALQISVPPEQEITQFNPDLLNPKQLDFQVDQAWDFPAASVTAIELDCTIA